MTLTANNNFRAEILVADHTPANLCLLGNILQDNGYKVRLVTDGYSVLEVAQSQPDLILLDILIPSLNGYEVCQKLKANPQTNEIPVIFLSALDEGLDKAKAFQVGGVDYITKPFQVEEILAQVAHQLTQHLLQKKLQQQTELLHQQNRQLQAEITERKLLEQKLLTSEEKMRAVFAAMTDIVIIIHLQEGQLGNIEILPTNWTSIDNTGTDIVSQTIEQFFQTETSETWLNLFQQALETQQTLNFDYSLTSQENIVWLTAAISPMRDNAIVLVARDISKRKQAEEGLRIAEERYHSIFENAIDGIFQSTPQGRYLSANPALAKIYGYSSSQELLQSIDDVTQQLYIEPDRRREFIAAIEANNVVSGFESMVYRKDGTPIWISETTRAVRDSAGRLLYYEGIVSEITERKVAQEVLKFQQAQSEELLLNILPQPIAFRLQAGESLIADQFDEVSVLFADLVGFTPFSAQKTPADLVEFLNEIFSDFDQLAEKHSLEKIKTIGDAYMVVGGLPTPSSDHAQKIAQMALDMQACLAKSNAKNKQELQLRIGINTGAVVAGVIGMSKFSYDLWGDTVNIASRMESSGLPGKIQVTPSTYECLKGQFEFKQRGIIAVKGKGEMMTYWLLSKT